MEVKLTIQERLKDLRVERHLTLEQLAEQTGLSKSALGKYESEDFKDISPYAIATLAKFYGVSADYLLGLTENKTPQTQSFRPCICGTMRYGAATRICGRRNWDSSRQGSILQGCFPMTLQRF